MLIIHDRNFTQHLSPPGGYAKGLVPRNYATHPLGCYRNVRAVNVPLIDPSEWSQRLKDMKASKSTLLDIRRAKGVPILDQNGKGYCWAHSTTGAIMTARAVMNEPTVELSAYMIACLVKNYRDEGGWGAESADFAAEHGVPSSQFWPQRSMSPSNDNAAMRQNAALHKLVKQFADMTAAEYDRNLAWNQYVSLWLSRCPTVNDYNWWSHSVHGVNLEDGNALYNDRLLRADSGKLVTLQEFEAVWHSDPVTAGYGAGIINSWGESYGDKGYGVIAGSKAVPDGGVGIMAVWPSAA